VGGKVYQLFFSDDDDYENTMNSASLAVRTILPRHGIFQFKNGLNAIICTSVAQPRHRTFKSSTTNYSLDNKEFPPNSSLVPGFVQNRNPRNLERLRIGNKPDGWWLDKPGRCYWNKVTLEVTARHIIGKVQHHEGQVPVSASTKEWCIKKFLYSTKDASAVAAVGKVLARRCLESGITEVYSAYTTEDRQKEKISLFLTALEKGGVSLTEPEQTKMPFNLNYPSIPEKSWEVFEEMEDELIDGEALKGK